MCHSDKINLLHITNRQRNYLIYYFVTMSMDAMNIFILRIWY